MRQWMILGLVLALGCAAAEAAPVNELEVGGTTSNNSFATAQAIPPSAFTLPVPPIVFDPPGFRTATVFGVGGGPHVDIYRISGHGTVLLDMDNDVDLVPFFLPDTTLIVFDSSGASLRVVDDQVGSDPGSFSFHDPRTLFNLPGPGVYFVAVSTFFNTICESPGPFCTLDTAYSSNGPQPSDPDAGGYRLHLSLEHPHRVPAPLTLALLVCSGGLALGARLLGRRPA